MLEVYTRKLEAYENNFCYKNVFEFFGNRAVTRAPIGGRGGG